MLSASVDISVQFYDLDPMNVVWHGNYARFFEQARCALLDLIDFNYDDMRQTDYVWPIVDMQVKYVQMITFRQKIRVTAELAEYENRLKIKYLITDAETGRRLTRGHTIQVAVHQQSKELSFVSPRVLVEKIETALCRS